MARPGYSGNPVLLSPSCRRSGSSVDNRNPAFDQPCYRADGLNAPAPEIHQVRVGTTALALATVAAVRRRRTVESRFETRDMERGDSK